MARLGVWTRLGIVLSGLVMVIAPVAFALNEAAKNEEAEQAWYEVCLNLAREQPQSTERYAAEDRCRDDRFNGPPFAFDRVWRDAAGVTAVLILICWILIGIAVAMIRWIWAGRKKVSPD